MASTNKGLGALKVPGVTFDFTYGIYVSSSVPQTSNYYPQLHEYTVTTERRLPPTEVGKSEANIQYQSRIRQLVVGSIEFNISSTNLSLLNKWMKVRLIQKIEFQSGNKVGFWSGSETDPSKMWRMDIARVTEAKNSIATLTLQFSKYSVWSNDPPGAAVADII